jgi:hypothetical protein
MLTTPPGSIRLCRARLWDDISDSWNQPVGNGAGVKNYIDFWAKNPQFAALRNGLRPGQICGND